MDFKDYFSAQAKEYSKYRPKYPPELFEYLSSLVKEHNLAWDCATGSGQAAIGLTTYFKEIIATDASPSQLEHAVQHSNIKYKAATAEDSGIDSHSVDLITVATAIHWIDTDKFYPEARRILKPGGVIAVWVYDENSINSEIDKISEHFSKELVGPYWPVENQKAWNFEERIDFPFKRIETPKFEINVEWNLNEYLSFFYTWSSTQNYIKTRGINPIELMLNDYKKAWGNENTKRIITWQLKIKAGRI